MGASSQTPVKLEDLSLAKEVHSDEVQPVRYRTRAIFVNREAELIERARDVYRRFIVGSKPSREHDRSEALQVERFARIAFQSSGLGHLRLADPPLRGERIEELD
jgi:hypothetical protein